MPATNRVRKRKLIATEVLPQVSAVAALPAR
jgi:hypothetical protein